MLTRKLKIYGIVQGVGFRPFVKRLADELGIYGFIRNEGFGVVILLQGDDDTLGRFVKLLTQRKPPASVIERIEIEEIFTDEHFDKFSIVESKVSAEIGIMPTDLAVCDKCISEMYSPKNPRYLYPFINCTNCGPRFTIIRGLPYDRPMTTMSEFEMCKMCRTEYENPDNRRYHAQPIACPKCGPQYFTYPEDICDDLDVEKNIPEYAKPVAVAAKYIAAGKIVAVEGIGGFHLVCDARNDDAISRLRQWKRRKTKPFAIMVRDIKSAMKIAEISDDEKQLLQSPSAPILLVKIKENNLISNLVAPELADVGVFLPYAPVHHLLFHFSAPEFLIATSGNRSDEPIAKDFQYAKENLDIADLILWHNREIHNRADDSVGFVLDDEFIAIRRARGFVPQRYELPRAGRKILAAGADMKGGVAFCDGKYIYPSQYLGELSEILAQNFWRETVGKFLQWLKFQPDIVVSDSHPDYYSSRLAKEFASKHNIPIVDIQHHRAHAWSVVAEHRISKPAIAVIYDGTGLGDDGKIWGGEFFLVNPATGECKRIGHLREIVQPGGDSSAVHIKRMALAYLLQSFGSFDKIPKIPIIEQMSSLEIDAIVKIFERNRPPITTSIGRLFDAVAAITSVVYENEFEAKAPMVFEAKTRNLASDNLFSQKSYEFEICEDGNGLKTLNFARTIRDICDDVLMEKPVEIISARFHRTITEATAELIEYFCEKFDTDTVLLSGGVFQNRLLLEMMKKRLSSGIELKFPLRNPANDQGIALGQAYWASLFG